MSIRRTAAAIALIITVSFVAAELGGSARADDKDITLSGCLVRAEDGDGYLLTNMPGEPAWQRSADATILPGAVGTTGSFATIFYWLDDEDDLKNHVGHLIAVEGKLEGELEDGEIKIERKDKWTEISIQSGGRDLKARMPHSSIVALPGRDRRKLDVLVRKVDVQRIRMISAACQP